MNFTAENVSGFEILSSAPSDSHATRILCQGLVGLSFRNILNMTIRGLIINSCDRGTVAMDGFPTTYGMSFHSVLDTSIANCSFQNSNGTAVRVFHSNLNLKGSNHFRSNCRRCGNTTCLCLGGGIYAYMSNLMFIGNSTFRVNSAASGGGICAWSSTLVFSGSSTFGNNSAAWYGGSLALFNSFVTFNGYSIFRDNSAEYAGGGIYGQYSTLIVNGSSSFVNNSATLYGGGIAAGSNTLTTFKGNSFFTNNSAQNGGGIFSQSVTLNFNGNITFRNNSAALYGGGIVAAHSTFVNFNGSRIFRTNSAGHEGGGIYSKSSTLNLNGNSIFGNNSAVHGGGGIQSYFSTLNFNGNSTFGYNSVVHYGGGIVALYKTQMTFNGNSIFRSNSAESEGGGIHSNSSTLTFNGNSIFRNNSTAHFGGGIDAVYSTHINFNGQTIFWNNSAEYGGGINAQSSTLKFSGNSCFSNNSAEHYGGGIIVAGNRGNSVMTFNGNSIFKNNSAEYGGGLLVQKTIVNFNGDSNFGSNSAAGGGGMYASYNALVNFRGNSIFRNNSAKYGGGISAWSSTLYFSGSSTFANNSAARYGGGIDVSYNVFITFVSNIIFGNNNAGVAGGGIFTFQNNTLSFTGNVNFTHNSALNGGGVSLMSSALKFTGICIFTNNSVIHGRAVYTEDSVLSFQGHNYFCGNSAQYSAGGVYSKNSNLTFNGSTSFNSNSGRLLGGGIYGFGTLFYLTGNCSFIANTAARGGGEYLVNSFNILSLDASVTMDSNNATEYGGAVYVEDSDPVSYCSHLSLYLERCLFQVDGSFRISRENLAQLNPTFFYQAALHEILQLNDSTIHTVRELLNISIHFHNNYAQKAGSAVYGGSIDNCVIELGVYITLISWRGVFRFNWHVPNLELEPNSISSDPFQVCLCKDGRINCNTSELDRQMQVYPGQLLKLPVVATGQRDGIVPAVVRALFNATHKNVTLAPFQDTQNALHSCTELYYQVYSSSSNNSGTLVLYADGPCSTDGKTLDISLEFLDCPPGFSLNPSEGTCECEPRLQKYTTRCNVTERTLQRSGVFWVGYDDRSEGLILHPHCPFDYCISANIKFTLNDTDKQCENNRSGLLCGGCKSGLSLMLGSSKCLQCSDNHIFLLIPFALAGIALILLLFILKLTVAAGTINGLIFYANIVAVNRSIFFPPNETNILTVFIAWLN